MRDSRERMQQDVVSMGGNHSTGHFDAFADLASARVGGRAIVANDEFFASKSNLLKPGPAIFIPGRFTARGKWMDGWETRRRRTSGHDWCVIQLGMRGIIRGINVNTSHFTGNYPSHCSIDALDAKVRSRALDAIGTPGADAWAPLLPKLELRGDSDNVFEIDDNRPWTHVRINIFPDGGVARLRVYGEVVVDRRRASRGGRPIDLAAIQHGGLVLGASDMHFGAKDNIIMPGRARNIADGWETRRRRGPGHDWAIVRLGATGVVSRVEIDTNHFKGNYPESASLEGCLMPGAPMDELGSASWDEVLPRTKLRPHHRHFFSKELKQTGPFSHVRLNILPDGGISRLRIHGTLAPA